mmetsp:Transcript_15833/g.36093  ORF Transcript_15833/g.36093 Transcript_15833/m.36093 type:complete len:249 (+) Transcript_15833:221-967(+)
MRPGDEWGGHCVRHAGATPGVGRLRRSGETRGTPGDDGYWPGQAVRGGAAQGGGSGHRHRRAQRSLQCLRGSDGGVRDERPVWGLQGGSVRQDGLHRFSECRDAGPARTAHGDQWRVSPGGEVCSGSRGQCPPGSATTDVPAAGGEGCQRWQGALACSPSPHAHAARAAGAAGPRRAGPPAAPPRRPATSCWVDGVLRGRRQGLLPSPVHWPNPVGAAAGVSGSSPAAISLHGRPCPPVLEDRLATVR